jgi:hypothetical protein
MAFSLPLTGIAVKNPRGPHMRPPGIKMIERMDRAPAGRRVVIFQHGDPLHGRRGRVLRYPDAFTALVLPFPVLRDPEPYPAIVMRTSLRLAKTA